MAGRQAKAVHKNIGGGTWYNASESNVAKEAKERAKGGRIKRAYGGRTVGAPTGKKAGGRLDKRARGGGIANLGKYAHGGKVNDNDADDRAQGVKVVKKAGGGGVGADKLRRLSGAVAQDGLNRECPLDDMIVGHDIAVRVDNHS